MEKAVATYEPDNSLKKGYLHIFTEILREFKQNRWLIYQLFKRDFVTMYKQSFVGVLWAFIIPIASVGTFIVLNRSGVFSIGDIDVPYPIYAILGMTFWQLFSTGLIAGSDSLVKAGPMIGRINFSKKALVIASIGRAIISFLIQMSLVAILFGCYRITPSVETILLPVTISVIVLFTLGLGFILSLINGVIRDIGNVLPIFMTFLMFLTPILYANPEVGILASITRYNPLYYMISACRDLVLTGNVPLSRGYLATSAASIVVFIMCLIAFHLTETRITERV